MRNANRSTRVIVGGMVLICASTAFAQDWPQWRGPNRDGKVSGFAPPATWPTALGQKWSTTVGAGDATPALVGDRLYVFTRQGDEEIITCLNATDGTELWSNKYTARPVKGAGSRHPGPRSSPAVAEGKVVSLGASGVVSCLDARTGKLVWQKDPYPNDVPQFYTASSPMIVDGMAIVEVGGGGNGGIDAFDLDSGDPKWQWTGEGPAYSSPVLLDVDGTKQIVTLTDKSIVGVGVADGKLLWQLPFAPAKRAYNAATPIVHEQTVIYTGARRGTFAVKIEKQGDGFAAQELWSNPDLAPQFNTPVLKDGLLYGLSDQGQFFCINAQTGQAAWTDGDRQDRSGFGAIVDAGPVLLALPSSSELIAFKPSGNEYAELARIKVSDTSTYAHPLVAGNRIFIKDENALTMWTIE